MKRLLNIALLSLVLFAASCDSKGPEDVFNYDAIMYKEFRFSIGKTTAVTINRSIETDGDISADGKYFFYASNEASGNYDIYLRSMTDITTVRVTDHPSKDISPVISPDGKELAFVSFRTDPEGDIFVRNISPGKLIKEKSDSTSFSLPGEDSVKLKNLTEEKTPSGVVRAIKDYSPVWSSDGENIAFTSEREGEANVWIMDRNGKNKRRLTKNGGVYPSFSGDGKSILYVSYKDSYNGEVYKMDLASGKETRLTRNDNIKLYPSFSGKNIIYTSIESDTNRNGKLDLNDRAIIRFKNISKNVSYPLTRKSRSSLKAKWLPVLKTPDFNGVIIFSSLEKDNINLNLLPETGIIPKKINARLQYNLCEKFLNEFQDIERYIMSLEAVYQFYGDDKKLASSIYVDRALGDAINYYRSAKEKNKEKFILEIIKKRVDNKDHYAEFILNQVKGRSISFQKKFLSAYAKEKFAPFAMEDLGDTLYVSRQSESAKNIDKEIIKSYPKYERELDINNKINLCDKIDFTAAPSESFLKILKKGKSYQKISLIRHVNGRYVYDYKKSDYSLKGLLKLRKKFINDKKVYPIVGLSLGMTYLKKGKVKAAVSELKKVIKTAHPNDLTYYYSNVIIGRLLKNSRKDEADGYLYSSVDRYSRRFNDFNLKGRIEYLVSRYKEKGADYFRTGDYKSAVAVYEQYRKLLDKLFSKRIYTEIYEKYAPGAQLLYVDSFVAKNGSKGIYKLEGEYSGKLKNYRIEFNKPYLYGLAYIYALKGMDIYGKPGVDGNVNLKGTLECFQESLKQIEWCIFIDDGFIEPYLLKTWIYQFVDRQRLMSDGSNDSLISDYFPEELFEENIEILKKALAVNDEKVNPENEGNIYLNMGNNYFLLSNYTRSLDSYKVVSKYKKHFNSAVEKAMFHFHYSYSLWQNGDIPEAKREMIRANTVYQAAGKKGSGSVIAQMVFMKYFALFSRYEKNFNDAIYWYSKILKTAEKHRIVVDRARIMQELAFCHSRLGDNKKAREYIAKSEKLLKDYPNDTREYNTKIKLFGFLPIFSLNLGPDAVVIGENKIFYPLDRDSKKLLNLSLEEEISLNSGDYGKAIEFLNKKVSLLKDDTSTAKETKIRSLNNMAFYFFKKGDLQNSEIYFVKARKAAIEFENLQGIFKTTMNLVNLYSYIYESNKNSALVNEVKIEKLSREIVKYRTEYEDKTYEAKLKDLKDAAEAKKKKVTKEDEKSLRMTVKEDAVKVYYQLDMALGTLKFLNGEILSVKSAESLTVKGKYSQNKKICGLYSDAQKLFSKSMTPAEQNGMKELQIRLFMNISLCNVRLGDFEKAYVSLIDAEDMAVKSGDKWLSFVSKMKLGMFLLENRKALPDISGESYRFVNESVTMVLKEPSEFTSRKQKILMLLDNYSELLKERGIRKVSERFSKTVKNVREVL